MGSSGCSDLFKKQNKLFFVPARKLIPFEWTEEGWAKGVGRGGYSTVYRLLRYQLGGQRWGRVGAKGVVRGGVLPLTAIPWVDRRRGGMERRG